MPKGIKTAPPQQSSLQEMWGGKKKAKPAAPAKTEASAPEASEDAGAMQVDGGPAADAKPDGASGAALHRRVLTGCSRREGQAQGLACGRNLCRCTL
jgi:DNA ligase-1